VRLVSRPGQRSWHISSKLARLVYKSTNMYGQLFCESQSQSFQNHLEHLGPLGSLLAGYEPRLYLSVPITITRRLSEIFLVKCQK
jgi:hypothetical protein